MDTTTPAPAQQRTRTGTATTATQRPKSDDVNEQPELSISQLLKERKKAQARLAQAQNDLAKLKQQDRKLDTHFKIMLGSWILAASKKTGLPILDLIEDITNNAQCKPHPDLIEWIKQLDAEEEEKRKKRKKA